MLKGTRKEKGSSTTKLLSHKKKPIFNIREEFFKNRNRDGQRLWLTNNAPFFSSTADFICQKFLSLQHKLQRFFFPQLELHEQKEVLYAWKARLDERFKVVAPADNNNSLEDENIVYKPFTLKSN